MKNEEMKKKWCRNLLGYCPTVSQYSEELYCDTAGLESAVGSNYIAIEELYFNLRGLMAGKLYCNRDIVS